MAMVFFGLYALVKGYLLFRSTFLPRALAVLSVTGGLGWMIYLYEPLALRPAVLYRWRRRYRGFGQCDLAYRFWRERRALEGTSQPCSPVDLAMTLNRRNGSNCFYFLCCRFGR
jgi:hypothetical protein